MFKYLLPFLLIFFSFVSATAQGEIGVQMYSGVLQNAKANPAWVPDEKLVISLAGVSGSYFHTAGSAKELLDTSNDTITTLRTNTLLNNLKADNTLRVHLELETFHIHFRHNEQLAFSLHHATKSNSYLRYSDTLPKLFLQGNAQYIGEDVAFGPDQHSFAYNEIGLGTALSFGKLTVGAKAKLLLGIGDISTSATKASLYTDPDIYQLTMNNDYRVNTATFNDILLVDTLSGYNVEYGFKEMFSFKNAQSGNSGYAFDLGVQYKITDQLSVGASILDLGKINWRKNIVNYSSKGILSYDGLDLSGALNGDAVSLENALDTVQQIFQFTESEEEYETALPHKIYLNVNYELSSKLALAGTYYHELYRGRNFQAVGIGAQYQLNKFLAFGLSYNARNESYFNIGMSLIARTGPVQLFLSTDNVAVVYEPLNNNNVNARIGLNLILDKNK
jgi:opacity protein-like surface antigen